MCDDDDGAMSPKSRAARRAKRQADLAQMRSQVGSAAHRQTKQRDLEGHLTRATDGKQPGSTAAASYNTAIGRGDGGIPAGCVDWTVEGGKLVPSEKEENWRSSGNTVCRFGFELTQDLDNQQVNCHTLPTASELHCRV